MATKGLNQLSVGTDQWADIIDMLSMHPEARRAVVRQLAEIAASD